MSDAAAPPTPYDAWADLPQAGRLLDRRSLDGLPPIDALRARTLDDLRDALTHLAGSEDVGALGSLLDTVLLDVAGLRDGWRKQPQLTAADAETLLDGTTLKPRWVLGQRLAVFTTGVPRIGLHQGRRVFAHVVEYLRRRRITFGLLTNGRAWRLVFADADNLAWVEWFADQWLSGDVPTQGLTLFRRLLSPAALTPGAPDAPLLAAVRATRRGQAQLSSELGENVRRAVERLLQSRRAVVEEAWSPAVARDTYDAACRFVMRLVVVLFAEARDLLPIDNPIYHHGYGLRGLLESFQGVGAERLRQRHAAWPRLLGLFQLLHDGSAHPRMVVPPYGGELFRAGSAEEVGLRGALARVESGEHPPTDEVVRDMVHLLSRTTESVRHGAQSVRVPLPVDFSELTSEYIGILYEGLLDYELHRAGEGGVVFLRLGDQPALPLDVLEAMDDKRLAALVEKVRAKRAPKEESEDSEGDEAEDDDAPEVEPEAGPEGEPELAAGGGLTVETDDDERRRVWERALAWGRRAALVGKLVPAAKKGGGKKGSDPAWERALDAAGRGLLEEVKLPGELYLVRWGGTRKGAGTFYTRPQLTLPTVRRTLEPLVYEGVGEDRAVRSPEALLALKVCDPAMGSGSFLVAALRVMTEAVVRSLHVHGRVQRRDGKVYLDCALVPEGDREQPEDRIEAIVRRAVVEQCLYGVDLDGLAVELARVALWVETLDHRLPFTFLDHKLRCGNALVGAWLDRFRDYPLLAWWRQSPDLKWRGVHHDGDVWAEALKTRREKVVTEQAELLTGQLRLVEVPETDDALRAALGRVRELHRALHEIPATRPDERARVWHEKVEHDIAVDEVRRSMDVWCALWFWPLDKLELAPGPVAMNDPSEEARAVAAEVARRRCFFHWELEFPDVFVAPGAGFDAVVANPPWETLQPQSKEFFSDLDPMYRSYGKQEALARQRELFADDKSVEDRWLDHLGGFRDIANFVRFAAEPYGDVLNDKGAALVGLVPRKASATKEMHQHWLTLRAERTGLSEPKHAFIHQGDGKPYSYKLFVEQAHALLKPGGQFGVITPGGIYTDQGAIDLRRLLLERCEWRWLYGFENRDRVFDIHRSFKFAITVASKGGRTVTMQAAFMRHESDDWGQAKGALTLAAETIRSLSPKSMALLEIRTARDLDVLIRMYSSSVLLGADGSGGWGVKYAQGDFNMTSDSKLFIGREKAEAAGYRVDDYGRWVGPEGDVLLPLYEGRMIGQFDFSRKGWVSGKGRTAVWRDIGWDKKVIEPQFVVRSSDYHEQRPDTADRARVVFMDVASATNARTMSATALSNLPCGNSAPILLTDESTLALSAVLNSYAYDFAARARCGGLHLNYFVVEETPLIRPSTPPVLARLTAQLNWSPPLAPLLLEAFTEQPGRAALTSHERLRIRCILDAIVAALYGLTRDDFRWILRDCDHPIDTVSRDDFRRALDPKGFWRIDRDQPPELRHTVLSLVAFDALLAHIAAADGDTQRGIAAFAALHDGEGWQLPTTLRLADYHLGHDDPRAQSPQPVASALGTRWLDWQLTQTPEESWAECERHARALLGDAAYEARFGKSRTTPEAPPAVPPPVVDVAPRGKAPEGQLAFNLQPATVSPRPASPPIVAPEPPPMTLSRVRLLNFRQWTTEHWAEGIALRPITLFLGRNSAGKTSILQPLRMVKQTLEATDDGIHLELGAGASDGVQLGGYSDVVHDHDESLRLGVGIDIEGGVGVDVEFAMVNKRPVIATLTYRLGEERVTAERTERAY
ncbi:MAG: hypothetical protein KA978_03765, partial [Deltaproteobacteria bacterium]|nr:hypothetical protein [Deltaproteobacteria bacterium]